jgi:CRP/FNR family transcriptional regulator
VTDAEILARCPLFAALGDEDLHALARIAERRSYAGGASLFQAGDAPEALHVVTRGAVRIHVASPETGRPVLLTVETPYRAAAELPSFDGGPYPAHGEAEGDTGTLALPQGRLDALLDARPGLSRALLRTLGRRLRRLVGLIERLSFQEVSQRLAAALLARAEQGLPFELPSNAALAAELGTVPELASRNLSRLAQEDLVRLNGRTVRALAEDELRRLAESARK